VIVRKFPIEHLDPISLLGHNDSNVRQIEREIPVRITLRDGTLSVAGEEHEVKPAVRVLEELVELVERGRVIEEADVSTALGQARRDGHNGHAAPDGNGNGNGKSVGRLAEAYDGAPGYTFDRKAVRPRTPTQAMYLKALEQSEVVFGIGPAGTGKTYLAVAARSRRSAARRWIASCSSAPAVEAGESLGFLPGDMQEKVDPYLRPMYDALADLMSYDKMRRFLEMGVIEIAPLAFMRGRTLSNAFVILDEAQNTTVRQMKMFLTRPGVELARGDHRRPHADRPARSRDLGSRAHPVDPEPRLRHPLRLLPSRGRGPPPPGEGDHPRVRRLPRARGREDRRRHRPDAGSAGEEPAVEIAQEASRMDAPLLPDEHRPGEGTTAARTDAPASSLGRVSR
jgi:phosphate starvation-inducible PhoH-like protein